MNPQLHDSSEDSGSRVPTPVASSHTVRPFSEISTISPSSEKHDSLLTNCDTFSVSLAPVPTATALNAPEQEDPPTSPEPPNNQFLLPLPTPSSRSQSFSLPSDAQPDPCFIDLPSLPPEVASADIAVATDGSFVETSSGAAARELKRIYDQHFGVGKDVRSPYAITAFVNQHGKQMYRLGTRELSAPAATTSGDADIAPSRAKSQSVSKTSRDSHASQQVPKPKRGSRMSVHAFLPPTMFKNGSVPAASPPAAAPALAPATAPVSKPQHVEDNTPRSPPGRKLRKTRSIPNMAGSEGGPHIASTQAPNSNGRPHAHSVSSADAYRASAIVAELGKSSHYDILSSVLAWNAFNNTLRSSSSAIHIGAGKPPPDLIAYPFGPGVSFESPSWRSSNAHLSSPPVLREMQSFESGLTARADPSPRTSRIGKLRMMPTSEIDVSTSEISPTSGSDEMPPHVFEASAEPSMVSRYSTDLFDVLQNYSGLPSLDKISPVSPETTIRFSLKTEETAAPRDDPRFVIWGEAETDDMDDANVSRGSATDLSSGQSGVSRRKSGKRNTFSAAENPFVRVSSGDGSKKVLVAATIERWIAQLTSELNYDELLIFFLTYRTYISAEDLGHLLICRFHWALGQPASAHDEMVRRIVRVRTFIAIRYWLLTFFTVDFVPNRELRLLFANWLNSLLKDSILSRHKDALNLVRKLRKVVVDCKDAHTRKGRHARPSADSSSYTLPSLGDLSDGHFADSLRKAVTKEDDADIDLDFDGLTSSSQGFRVNSSSSPAKNPNTSVDLALLRQPLLLAFLQHSKQTATSPSTPAAGAMTLPVPHSAISRVIVNTMGRLGRWKRVLNSRSQSRAPLGSCVDMSAFDIEGHEMGSDLLLVAGGVEQYLRALDGQGPRSAPPAIASLAPSSPFIQTSPPPATSEPILSRPPTLSPVVASSPPREPREPTTKPSAAAADTRLSRSVETDSLLSPKMPSLTQSATSLVSPPERPSTDSATTQRRWPLDVVSLDDLDLSDLSSDEGGGPDLPQPPGISPGIKKTARRLPNRRDFEFVRHSVDSVSSMGIRTHESVMSTGSSSVMSSGSASGVELGGTIHPWQMTALVDSLTDDGEEGDIEAALRRLEGQINQDKQKAKQSKVDGWVKSIRERMAGGLYDMERPPRFASDDEDEEEDYGQVRNPGETSFSQSSISSRSSLKSAPSPSIATSPQTDELSPTGISTPASVRESPLTAEGPAPPQTQREVLPAARHLNSRPHTAGVIPRHMEGHGFPPPAGHTFIRKGHRSFVDTCSSSELVQHFSLIDRELFLNLDFEELVARDWAGTAEVANILDWGEFLKDRARARVEGRPLADALTVIRARFNLVANFAISEIVLTHPGDRHKIIAKFIRIAFKAFNLRNFNLLVSLIAALKSDWVVKATKQAWSRVGIWESRMLSDLIVWTSSAGDFKYIRAAVDALSETKASPGQDPSNISTDGQSSTTRSRAASEGKLPPPPPGCIPFFGIYLSSLHRYSALPDLIDPTAPNEPVIIDPSTNSFQPPAHPKVFSTLAPLPSSVQLEPLINVHKQRLIADVVKSLVSGQHLAARVQYPVDKKLFQKCTKLRGLDSDTLTRLLALYPGERG